MSFRMSWSTPLIVRRSVPLSSSVGLLVAVGLAGGRGAAGAAAEES
jgi:hypothetical protein